MIPAPPSPHESLGEAVPKEIARVLEIAAIYDRIPMGHIAASMMRADINLATKALAEGDVVTLIRAYESLKGYKL